MFATGPLSQAPVVAFDVDGVLRSLYRGSEAPAVPVEQKTITFRQEAYPLLYHSQPPFFEGTYTATLTFNLLGLEWVKSLLARDVQVVLATTWQGYANEYFLSSFGIPTLEPAVRTLAPFGANREHCSHAWKAKQLAHAFPGRPLLWVDDSYPHAFTEQLNHLRHPEDAHLSRHLLVEGRDGLTPEEVESGEEWLSLVQYPAGHRLLKTAYEEQKRLLGSAGV